MLHLSWTVSGNYPSNFPTPFNSLPHWVAVRHFWVFLCLGDLKNWGLKKERTDVLDSILNSNFLLTWIWGHCICPKTPELSLLLVKDPIKTAWDTCSIHVTYFPCQQQPLSLDSLLCSAFTSTLCSLHLRPTLSQFSSTTAKAHLFLFVSLFVSQHLQSPIVNLPPLPAGLLISSLLVNDH